METAVYLQTQQRGRAVLKAPFVYSCETKHQGCLGRIAFPLRWRRWDNLWVIFDILSKLNSVRRCLVGRPSSSA